MMKRIPIADIFGNPDQPRKTFDEDKLRELAASIRENGLQQPITVRPCDDGRYMIVMGERRWRAHQLLAEAGQATDILCHVSKVDDKQLAINAIIENDQRVDVPPLEQARSYQRMIDDFGYDLDGLAKKLGKAPFRIEERLRLLKLSDTAQQLLASGNLNPTQAYYMAELSEAGQTRLLRAINAGQVPTNSALKAAAAAIKDEESQTAMFGDDELPPPPTDTEQRQARGFMHKVEQIAAMLRDGIDDNTITAVKKVSPDKAGYVADLLSAAQKDMRRIEDQLRAVAATQAELGEAA